MTGDVHPFAARFPMLSEEEIADLAADIKANGLIHPIVLDGEGQLIDGRNRLAACKVAGVEPHFTTLNGHHPIAYILSSNVRRRQLSKGQQAMFVAEGISLFLGNNRPVSTIAAEADVPQPSVAKAMVVRQYAPDLVDVVIRGDMPLKQAYETAQANKTAQATAEDWAKEEARTAARNAARLRAAAPDLAELVTDGKLPMAEAIAVLDKREADERDAWRRMTRYTVEVTGMLQALVQHSAAELFDHWDDTVAPARAD